MRDMRALGVGTVAAVNNSTPNDGKSATNGDGNEDGGGGASPGGGGGKEARSGVLSPECYAPLVEAYAQASMWDRTIEAFQEGFVVGPEGVKPVDYRVRGGAQLRRKTRNMFFSFGFFVLFGCSVNFFKVYLESCVFALRGSCVSHGRRWPLPIPNAIHPDAGKQMPTYR